jgi:hypothetical protein
VGVIIGVVVLLISLALVAVMMWSEWSQGSTAQPLAEAAAPSLASKGKRAPAKKAAAKKAPAKKKKK